MTMSDKDLDNLYQSLDKENPPAALDNAILAAAQSKSLAKSPKRKKPYWYWGTGVAASALLVALLINQQTDVLVAPASIEPVQPSSAPLTVRARKAEPVPQSLIVETEQTFNAKQTAPARLVMSDVAEVLAEDAGESFAQDTATIATNAVNNEARFAELDELLEQVLATQPTDNNVLFAKLVAFKKANPTISIPPRFLAVLTEEQKQKLNTP